MERREKGKEQLSIKFKWNILILKTIFGCKSQFLYQTKNQQLSASPWINKSRSIINFKVENFQYIANQEIRVAY